MTAVVARLCALSLALATTVACSGGSTPSEPPPSTGASDGTGAASQLWPIPDDPMALTRRAGLKPETHEFLVHHYHAHLDVFVDGQPVQVPAGIGIDISNPAVKTFDAPDNPAYGGIETPCKQACISPLHTHDSTGIVHTESASPLPNTLKQLFTEWGLELTSTCLADRCGGVTVYVDGKQATEDIADIQLIDLREIAVVVGEPPATIPKTADFSKA